MLSNLSESAHLDPRTLIGSGVFVAFLATGITALVWKARPTNPGFGYWLLGNASGCLCLLLLSLRGLAPDWLSVVVANALALASAVLFLQGTRLFRGIRLRWVYESLAAGATAATVVVLRYATDNITARTCLMGLVLGAFGLISGVILLNKRHGERTFGMVITGIAFLAAAIGNILHAGYAAFAPVKGFFEPYGPNLIFLAGSGLVVMGWTFGFILMAGESRAIGSEATTGLSATDRVSQPPVPIPEQEVREQVGRIIDSDLFRKSPRMERFLKVAVDRTLRGQPEALKEYTLGRDVFDRAENYDPRLDSIVRVEAQRLRRKLSQYYQSHGSDPILVEFNPGSYVPTFRYRLNPHA